MKLPAQVCRWILICGDTAPLCLIVAPHCWPQSAARTAVLRLMAIWIPYGSQLNVPETSQNIKYFTHSSRIHFLHYFSTTQSNMKGRIFNIMPHYCTTAHHSWETPCSHYSWLHCMQFRYHWGESLKHEADKRIPQNWAHYGTTCIMGKRLPQLGLVGSIFLEKWVNEMSSSCSLSLTEAHTQMHSALRPIVQEL